MRRSNCYCGPFGWFAGPCLQRLSGVLSTPYYYAGGGGCNGTIHDMVATNNESSVNAADLKFD